MVVADGYLQIGASFYLDEDVLIPFRIVDP